MVLRYKGRAEASSAPTEYPPRAEASSAPTEYPPRAEASSAPTAGFSLIEVAVAAAIMLIIAVGTLPMFTRAMSANVSGNDSTQVANYARERAEEFLQLPFNPRCTLTSSDPTCAAVTADDPSLEVPAGSTERVFDEYYRDEKVVSGSPVPAAWVAGTEADAASNGDTALFTRTTTVRQYWIGAIDDGTLDSAEALDGGADTKLVRLKEIQVVVENVRPDGSILGPGKTIGLRVLKSQ